MEVLFFCYNTLMLQNQKKIIEILKAGGVGVYPTDTLYGLVGSALSREAVKRIYDIKGRDENKPFIILVSSILDIEIFVRHSALKKHEKFLQDVWAPSTPLKRNKFGAVSVIVPVPDITYAYLHRGTKSLAFRIPKDRTLRNFLKLTGPLVAPSANPQSLKPASTIAEAKKYFGEKVDFYVSGGRKTGKPSTVISLLEKKPKVIRGEFKLDSERKPGFRIPPSLSLRRAS